MARQPSFPTVIQNVREGSRPQAVTTAADSLHTPLFFFFAEKGKPNVPVWGSGTDMTRIFGAETFNERGVYFNHQTLFAARAAAIQGIYGVRLLPSNAAYAGEVLEMRVKEMELTQYEKDEDTGARLVDEDGEWIPRKEVDGVTILTEPGVQVQFVRRALANNEVYTNIATTTNAGVTVYPLVATHAEYPGAYTNRTGFRLYYSPNYDSRQVVDVSALTYRFEPMEIPASSTTATSLRDRYGSSFVDITLQTKTVDPKTAADISLTGTLASRYVDNDGENLLPFKTHVYSANAKAVADLIKSKSPELGAGFNSWLINLLSGLDADGHEYDHYEVYQSEGVVASDVILYNTGGSDGTMTTATFESAVVAYLNGGVYPAIKDNIRYPFTHIYDSGFTLETKMDMMAVFNISDAVGFTLSTQDVSLDYNTQAEDMSTGTALRQRVSLNTESIVEGTGACRADIYAQSGRIASSSTYLTPVPMTLDRLLKRCAYEGGTFRSGTPKGRPASEVTSIVNVNWTPTSDDQKQESWDNAINYVQYADRNTLFYPDLRSVYAFDDSLLSSNTFVDALIYIKHIVRQVWTVYVGLERDPQELFTAIEQDIDIRINRAFNGSIGSKTVLYRTDASNALGYAVDATVTVSGVMPNRVWNVVIPVVRADSATSVAA